MKRGQEPILANELSFRHSTEHAAFMAVIDLENYKLDVSKNPEKFIQEFAQQVREERAFAWGCPEQDFAVKLTIKPLAEASTAVPSAVGYLTTAGRVCLTSFDHLSFSAQCPENKLPLLEASRFSDRVFTVKPGRYKVTVEQQFKWTPGQQFSPPLDESLRNYVIHFEPVEGAAPNNSGAIPFFSP